MVSKTRWAWRSGPHCRVYSSLLEPKPNSSLLHLFNFSPLKAPSFHLWGDSILTTSRSPFCHNCLPFFPMSTVSVCSPSFGLTPWCYLPMWVFRQVLALNSVPQWSHWDAWLFSSDPSFSEQPFFNNAPSQKPCLTPVKYSAHCSLQPWPKRPFDQTELDSFLFHTQRKFIKGHLPIITKLIAFLMEHWSHQFLNQTKIPKSFVWNSFISYKQFDMNVYIHVYDWVSQGQQKAMV